jgi:large subunit ribosomal protein L15
VKLHDLTPPKGSTHAKRRVGRGIAGKGGKTAGRGTKGQKARTQIPAGFEGGQQPILARAPKLRGFTNPFRVSYTPVNLEAIDALGLDEVGPEVLVAHGLAHKGDLVKVLARGSIGRAVRVSAHGFSKAAASSIEAAGGSTELIAMPFGNGRPPARGNQHTNR